MKKQEPVPTIDDITHRYLAFFKPRSGYICQGNIREMMLEFTKLHVEAALKAAAENVDFTDGTYARRFYL